MERQISVRLIRAIKEDHLGNIPVEPISKPFHLFVNHSFRKFRHNRNHARSLIRRVISSVRTFLLRQIFKAYKREKQKQ